MELRTVAQDCQDQPHQSDGAADERQGHNTLDDSKSGVSLGMVDRDDGGSHEFAPAAGAFDRVLHNCCTA
jgi:hypothetical protein